MANSDIHPTGGIWETTSKNVSTGQNSWTEFQPPLSLLIVIFHFTREGGWEKILKRRH